MKKLIMLLVAIAFIIPTVSCSQFKIVRREKPAIEVKKYRIEQSTQTAEELLAELTKLYGPPEMHSRSFTVFVNNEPIQINLKVYYYEVSQTHYTMVTTANGVVQNHDTIQKYRVH